MKKLFLFLAAVIAFTLSAAAQNRTVTGEVVSADNGEPLIGATVLGVGTKIGVATDIDGQFSLSLPQSVKRLHISYVGMESAEVDIPASGKVRITLHNSNMLDEVIAVAYGTATRASFTGSASVIDASQIEDRLVSDITQALNGSVVGVQTLSNNGQPGTSAKVRIRGVGSINASMDPLYVVDGVPFDGDIASINPADIETMTVLKDAAAAALYGARGANGVILITTKKGKSGDTRITFDGRWGANSRQVPNYDVISDPKQWYEINYQAQKNAAIYNLGYDEAAAHAYANSMMFKSVGYNVYTVPQGESLINPDGRFNPNATEGYSDGKFYFKPDNWADNTFKDGFRQEYNLSISGASDRFNYYISGTYLTDDGLINNSSFERLGTRTSLEYQAKSWLKIGTNLSYSNLNTNYPDLQYDANGSSGNAFYMAYNISPVYPMFVRSADGQIMMDPATGHPIYDYGDSKSTPYSRTFMNIANPVSDLLYNTTEYLTDIFSGKWFAQITPIEGLTVTGSASVNIDNTRYHDLRNSLYGQGVASGGEASQIQMRTRGLNLQGLANYKRTIAQHHNIDVLLGYESYDWNYEQVSAYGQGLYQTGSWVVDNTLTANRQAGGWSVSYATRGFFGRLNYDFDSRYFFSFSYRRDGSSCFHPDHRWGNFYSVSGAWDASNEEFLKDIDWIDMLKIKASFGQQGNDNLGRATSTSRRYYYFPYSDQYGITGTNSWSDGDLKFKGNKEITWEKSNSFNIGVDFSLLNSRLEGSVEYFNRQTSDMLYFKPVASSNGYSKIPMNIGSMRNNGLEIDLNYRPVQTKDITWDIHANVTFINNKILKLAPELKGELQQGYTIYREGSSMYAWYLPAYAGISPNTGEALYWALKPQLNDNGEQLKDENDVPLWTDEEYATTDYNAAYNSNRKAYDLMPNVYGGFGTTLNAYGFDFGIQFAYQLGGRIWDQTYQELMGGGTSGSYGKNWHKDILNAWTPNNTATDVPRLNAAATYDFSADPSDRVLVSSNYLALNNITIGYSIPRNMAAKLGLESLRIYGAADNVALWSARKGLDPRQSYLEAYGDNYSSIRRISGGIKVVF